MISSKFPNCRILAVHGSGGNSENIVRLLQSWDLSNTQGVDAPFVKENGFAWWIMPPFVRSFNATEYPGYTESSHLVQQKIKAISPELIIGHSQGAILLAAMLAENSIPEPHSRLFILHGAAWPNPFTSQMNSLTFAKEMGRPKILLVSGTKDEINPISNAERLAKTFTNAGAEVTLLTHPGGHSVPTKGDIVTRIQQWISERV